MTPTSRTIRTVSGTMHLALASTILIATILSAATLIATVLVSAAPAAAAPPAKKIRVLLVTGFDVGVHKWRETTEHDRRVLEETGRFDVRVCEDIGIFETSALSRYDAIVLNYGFWTHPDPSPAGKAGLLEYVRGGGGLVSIHFSCSAFQDWEEYGDLLGRVWKKGVGGHGPRGKFTVRIDRPDHPITRGLADFETDDELYARLSGDGEIEVLASAYSDWSKKREPIVFTRRYGKGRVVQDVLGHDVRARDSESVRTLLCRAVEWAATGAVAGAGPRIPVILDTDIGDDIDDTWALALLLRSPELDLKLVVGDNGNALYRARLIAKLLEKAGRSDVPVGVGAGGGDRPGRQSAWIGDYDLSAYPGKVHRDGVQALVDTIMSSPEPITVIAIGPVPNLALALEREPRIAHRARFVGMHGSVRVGYGGSSTPAAEYNVRADARSCQKVFTAPWEITITPLDTCGIVHLAGEKYRRVRDATDPLTRALIENYRVWAAAQNRRGDADVKSSTLFDTVAVYLAFSHRLVEIETLGIRVTDGGRTVIDPAAKKMKVATRWKDLGAFEDLLVERLAGPARKAPR